MSPVVDPSEPLSLFRNCLAVLADHRALRPAEVETQYTAIAQTLDNFAIYNRFEMPVSHLPYVASLEPGLLDAITLDVATHGRHHRFDTIAPAAYLLRQEARRIRDLTYVEFCQAFFPDGEPADGTAGGMSPEQAARVREHVARIRAKHANPFAP